MRDLVVSTVAGLLAILFVGYLAVKVGAIPLLVIVVCCLALMVYGLYQDARNGGGGG